MLQKLLLRPLVFFFVCDNAAPKKSIALVNENLFQDKSEAFHVQLQVLFLTPKGCGGENYYRASHSTALNCSKILKINVSAQRKTGDTLPYGFFVLAVLSMGVVTASALPSIVSLCFSSFLLKEFLHYFSCPLFDPLAASPLFGLAGGKQSIFKAGKIVEASASLEPTTVESFVNELYDQGKSTLSQYGGRC